MDGVAARLLDPRSWTVTTFPGLRGIAWIFSSSPLFATRLAASQIPSDASLSPFTGESVSGPGSKMAYPMPWAKTVSTRSFGGKTRSRGSR